jgi:WD40 repeat protein
METVSKLYQYNISMIRKTWHLFLVAILFTSCKPGQAPGPSLPPTAPIPPPATLAPTPSSTSTSTPIPPAEILLHQAVSLCDLAYDKEISSGTISGLIFTLVKSSTGSEGWQPAYGLYSFDAQLPDQAQALICIDETFKRFATYSDGSAANQIIWEARIVRWPSGEVVGASPEFQGDRPPQSKPSGGDPAYGPPPTGELIRWLAGTFSDQTIIVHEPYYDISNFAISPDGKTLVTVSLMDNRETYSFESSRPGNNTIKVWEVASGKLLFTFPLQDDGDVYAITISPDGQTLSVFINGGGYMGKICSWSLASGQIIKQQEIGMAGQTGYNNYGSIPVFSADASLFAIDHDDSVSIYKTANGALINSGQPAGSVRFLAFSPDKALFASSDLIEVKVWQAASGKLQFTLPGSMMVFSPDGQELVVPSGRDDWKGIEIVDALTGTVKHALGVEEYRQSEITSMAYSPDGTILAIISTTPDFDSILTLWNMETNESINAIRFPGPIQANLHQLVFSENGENLAINFITMDGTGYVRIIPLRELLINSNK